MQTGKIWETSERVSALDRCPQDLFPNIYIWNRLGKTWQIGKKNDFIVNINVFYWNFKFIDCYFIMFLNSHTNSRWVLGAWKASWVGLLEFSLSSSCLYCSSPVQSICDAPPPPPLLSVTGEGGGGWTLFKVTDFSDKHMLCLDYFYQSHVHFLLSLALWTCCSLALWTCCLQFRHSILFFYLFT